MKSLLFLPATAALLLTACSQKSDTPAPPASSSATPTNSVNAAGGYLGALARGQQIAVKTIDTTSLDKAIQMFAVENGRNPKDLNELVQQKYIPKLPEPPYGTKLVYDANSGTVKVVSQ
ncbi:MAG TPA: hypothetical protein VFE51_21320 [Verrucomicrobiae bacterium]|nr:hypothetical protein [Verrucomicrobiae bacterium]